MAGSWSWHCFDLATGAALAQVQMTAWSHEDRLNDSGSWSATLAPAEDIDHARYALNAVQASRATIVAVRVDDVGATRAEFTGWIPPEGNRRPDLTGKNLLGYLDFRLLEIDRIYTAYDQHLLVADLLIQSVGGMIDASQVTVSGVPRTQTWLRARDNKNIGEAIRQIAARINGFDFDVRTEWENGTLRRRLRCWYPRRGGILETGAPLTFELGRNMLDVPVPEGNAGFATRVIGLGKEQDAATQTRLYSMATNTTLTAAGFPIICKQVDRTDVTTQAGLDDVVAGELALASTLQDEEISFRVDPNDPTTRWGTWDLGADCLVKVPPGEAMWWPDGFEEQRRIVAHRWHFDAAVGESLEVVTGRKWEGAAP